MSLYYYILFGVIIIGLLVSFFLKKRKKKTNEKKYSTYIDALHLLLEGKKSKAVQKLKATIKKDSNNIMAYTTLGNLFREQGYPEQAAKIHNSLVIREDIPKTMIDTIYNYLIKDYIADRQFDKAIYTANKLAKKAKKNIKNNYTLLSLYEKKGDWENAFIYRQRIDKLEKKKNKNLLALYKVQSGVDLVKKEQEHDARLAFREAIKIDNKCIPAYLYLGDSYLRCNRQNEAVKSWKELTENIPEKAYLAFDRLKEILFELGIYGEIEKIYKQILKKNKDNIPALIALAEFYKKQGQDDKSIRICNQVLAKEPKNIKAIYLLITILQNHDDTQQALQKALDYLQSKRKQTQTYTCSECGYTSDIPLWLCPRCHNWDTFID
ncbi:MAG: tetratricopeptide repeat protein [bacterium]